MIYFGDVETLLYLIEQQDHFHIDLEQKDRNGNTVIEAIVLFSMNYNSPNALHLLKHFLEAGEVRDEELDWTNLCFYLRLQVERVSCSSSYTGPNVLETEMDYWMSRLTDHVAALEWTERCEYFLFWIAYNHWDTSGPAMYVEGDQTPILHLWLEILRKANISLHEFFRHVEEYLEGNKVPDVHLYRRGIERFLRIDYGSDPEDIGISVQEIRVEIPVEQRIPGAWCTGKTFWSERYGEEVEVIEGLEPTANWRVSSKDKWRMDFWR